MLEHTLHIRVVHWRNIILLFCVFPVDFPAAGNFLDTIPIQTASTDMLPFIKDHPPPAECDLKLDQYIAENQFLTISGLALELGFSSRRTLYDHSRGPGYQDAVTRARLIIEHSHELVLSPGTVDSSRNSAGVLTGIVVTRGG